MSVIFAIELCLCYYIIIFIYSNTYLHIIIFKKSLCFIINFNIFLILLYLFIYCFLLEINNNLRCHFNINVFIMNIFIQGILELHILLLSLLLLKNKILYIL